MAKRKQKIYGYVDITKKFKKEYGPRGGYKTNPAHHRNIVTLSDLEGSYHYHFLNPDNRDEFMEIVDEPLPIQCERDLEFFKKNSDRYLVYKAKRDYIEEYAPKPGDTKKPKRKKNVGSEVKDVEVTT